MPRRDDDGGGDRPRKSWREIDKARDSSRGGRSSGERPGSRERLERSQAYRDYKSNLDRFFEGFGFQLSLIHGTEKFREPASGTSMVVPLEEYTRNQRTC